jgi:hypothetical protein
MIDHSGCTMSDITSNITEAKPPNNSNDTPVKSNDTPVKTNDTPVNNSNTPVNSDTPVNSEDIEESQREDGELVLSHQEAMSKVEAAISDIISVGLE